MIGSNMFLIFRQGVRLLGGEFLRSKGNAAEKQAISWSSQQNRVNFLGEDGAQIKWITDQIHLKKACHFFF